ncbi:monocarboxylate transporter 13-like [Mercenaria mercenaria]|uniref:monocarboxylate transporter 13-like n=1 Tax=Mercenaria mercenaria TaxID=6596 RepID=UPI00234F724E|nr:monocarboxylate transporter 13-like [Mercenaria mercenaria]
MDEELNNETAGRVCSDLQHTTTQAEDELEPEVTDDINTLKYEAPDGGWGWIVCAACFTSHVLTDGILYSFGVVFVELLDYFGGSKGETAVIASISTGICYLTGPVVAIFTNRFGCRVVTFVGTVVFSGSLVLSMFAPNIQFLYLSLGAMVGIGYGMIYLPSIVCVSQYFEKRRAFATGIGVSGAGIGTFIFSPLTSVLIGAYAWQGAILIQAGLALNCFACALVFRPIDFAESKIKSGDKNSSVDEGLELTEIKENYQHMFELEISVRKENNICSKSVNGDTVDERDSKELSKHASSPLLNEGTRDGSHRTLSQIGSSRKSLKKNICSDIFNEVWHSIRSSFDVEIFHNVAYCMFLVSTFLYSLGYYIPYVYLPDTAREAGISDLQASFLVSSVGITNTVGRILFGFLSDRPWVNRLVLYATALVICGAATCVGPLLSSFGSLLVYTMVFGAFSGVTISLTSVLLSDIVGIHRLAHGLGVSNFFGGIGSFAGPPIAGWLYDISGDYLVSYIAAGTAIFVSGAMLYPVPYIENKFKLNKSLK